MKAGDLIFFYKFTEENLVSALGLVLDITGDRVEILSDNVIEVWDINDLKSTIAIHKSLEQFTELSEGEDNRGNFYDRSIED